MKIVNVDSSKRGKDIHYYKKILKEERNKDITAKINRIMTYQDLESRGRLITKRKTKQKQKVKKYSKTNIIKFPQNKSATKQYE